MPRRTPRAPQQPSGPAAFEALVAEYRPRIYRLALGALGEPEEAEDVTQQVLVNACRTLPQFRGDCKLQTWLYQIALNTCRNRSRDRARRARYEGPSLDHLPGEDGERVGPALPCPSPSPEEAVLRAELRRCVARAVAELPEEARLFITLCDLQQRSYAEIVELTRLPLGTVKARIHRARRLLRRRLAACLA